MTMKTQLSDTDGVRAEDEQERSPVNRNTDWVQTATEFDGRRWSSPAGIGLRQLEKSVLLMNVPLSLSTDEPNNIHMEIVSAAERAIDRPKALSQFSKLYGFLTQRAIVYLLPSRQGLQDQTYVGNVGAVLPHLDEETVVVSRFRSKPRVGEDSVALDFFKIFNFRVLQPPRTRGKSPVYFEGEADLKHVRDNLYIGASGLRTSLSALEWFAENFAMKVIEFPIIDERVYHLDSNVFVLDPKKLVMCPANADANAVREIERFCDIIAVSRDDVRSGITNSIIVDGYLLCDSPIDDIDRNHDYYESEKNKIARLEWIASHHGLKLQMFNLSEFGKSGAALSCLIMHLNHYRSP
jgi:N-dimethylarginine dimethylaminohydrolase